MTPAQLQAVQDRAICLHEAEEVEAALDAMAVALSVEVADRNPLMLCVMHGGLITAGKLATRLHFPLQMDYLHATRYREETSGRELQWKAYPGESLAGRTVVLVDDILDVGTTLKLIVEYCRAQGCEAVYSAVLLDKQHERKEPGIEADFVGLRVADHYLYGYGMDYRGYLRNAAGIYAIAERDR